MRRRRRRQRREGFALQKDIGGFEVPMQDPPGVHHAQPVANLNKVPPDLSLRKVVVVMVVLLRIL